METLRELREQIAQICGDAKYEDGASISWAAYNSYEKALAYAKADAILALMSAPESKHTIQCGSHDINLQEKPNCSAPKEHTFGN